LPCEGGIKGKNIFPSLEGAGAKVVNQIRYKWITLDKRFHDNHPENNPAGKSEAVRTDADDRAIFISHISPAIKQLRP